jgi:hypothetical protein
MTKRKRYQGPVAPKQPAEEEAPKNMQTRQLRPGEEIVFTMRFFQDQGKRGGELGGAAGGKATAAKMTPEERSAAAKKAVEARWAKYRRKRSLNDR